MSLLGSSQHLEHVSVRAVVLPGSSIIIDLRTFVALADSPGVGGQSKLGRRQVLVAAGAEVDVLAEG